jgi:hypothetical protein
MIELQIVAIASSTTARLTILSLASCFECGLGRRRRRRKAAGIVRWKRRRRRRR